MAFFTDIHTRDAGMMSRAFHGINRWVSDVAETMAQRRLARKTYTELSNLGARELADLGLTRSDLRRVAQQAAEGKL